MRACCCRDRRAALGMVYMNVQYQPVVQPFFNTLQDKNQAEFYRQITCSPRWRHLDRDQRVFAYLNQMLQIRWRRWLTDNYLKEWLPDRTYYRMQLTGLQTDNPDQRVAEDLKLFVDETLTCRSACSMPRSRWSRSSACCGCCPARWTVLARQLSARHSWLHGVGGGRSTVAGTFAHAFHRPPSHRDSTSSSSASRRIFATAWRASAKTWKALRSTAAKTTSSTISAAASRTCSRTGGRS